MTAVRLLISGRVQGVGFRWAVQRAARRDGLVGYARNLSDGRVEVWLEGDAAAVDRVAAFCAEGPEGASVSGVEREVVDPDVRSGFETG